MNKITIPIILTVTVILAGFFAFSPIDQASTVHSINLIESTVSAQLANLPLTIATDPITTTFGGATRIFHWIVLESTVPYTFVDIEIEGTLDAGMDDNLDRVRLMKVNSFNGEYATSVAGVTLAMITDNTEVELGGDPTDGRTIDEKPTQPGSVPSKGSSGLLCWVLVIILLLVLLVVLSWNQRLRAAAKGTA